MVGADTAAARRGDDAALRQKLASAEQAVRQLQAQVQTLQSAAALPAEILELLAAGDLEPILQQAGEETLRLKLYGARQALLAGQAALQELPASAAEDAAYRLGAVGAPHCEFERLLFESYLKGHCWTCGKWLADKRYYDDIHTRIMFALWRDRAALVLPNRGVKPATLH